MRYAAFTFLLVAIVAQGAHAQTTASLQAELNALLAQLAALQAQLGSAPVVAPTTVSARCPSLYRTLQQGVSGQDVSELQAFLATDTALYPEGTVSGYFGALTQRAVQRFQARHGIVTSGSPSATGFGVVGPMTRATISRVCASGTSAVTPTSGGCALGGITVPSGAIHTFYSTTQAPLGSSCATYAQTRQCIGGSLSGNASYQYRACIESDAPSCAIDGERVANGTAFTFYSRRIVDTAGETCSRYAQTRTCTNGVLSGDTSFRYLSCVVGVPESCTLNGVTVAHGQSRTFYRYTMATSTHQCSSYAQSRTCNDGILSGSSAYNSTSCSAGACLLDGVVYPHGSSSTFYLAQSIPLTEQCSSYALTRTCSSGSFSGNASYQYRTCAAVATGSCALDNVVLTSGQSRTFYSGTAAPVGTACSSIAQSRTCTSGTLSGSATYNRASCSDTSSCVLDGVTVSHGGSATFYSSRTVPYGSTCSSRARVRTCTNGLLSGGSTVTVVGTGGTVGDIKDPGTTTTTTAGEYVYASCSVNPPTTLAPSGSQFASALAALEALLKDALVQLDAWF